MDDWKDPQEAESWSADPLSHNPTRAEQLDIMVSILADNYRQGKTILDIGFGSGLVEELIFKRIPHAYIIGVDSSRAMLDLAHRRLAGKEGQYEIVMHDITETATLELPLEDYQVAISTQTIHNVANTHKVEIFRFIYNALEPGGLFLLLDRIALETPGLFPVYRSMWDRLDRLHNSRIREGSSFEEHTSTVSNRGDLPAGLEWHLDRLREAGFEAACVHLHGIRALFAARKPE